MTETYLQKLQREHKERRARIASAAKIEPIPEQKPAPPLEEEDVHFELDPKSTLFKEIFKKVCKYYKVSMLDIISARRNFRIVLARHVIAYIAVHHTELNISQIASRLGGKDRSTVVSSVIRIKQLSSAEDSVVAKDIAILKKSLNL